MGAAEWLLLILIIIVAAAVFTLVFRRRRRRTTPPSTAPEDLHLSADTQSSGKQLPGEGQTKPPPTDPEDVFPSADIQSPGKQLPREGQSEPPPIGPEDVPPSADIQSPEKQLLPERETPSRPTNTENLLSSSDVRPAGARQWSERQAPGSIQDVTTENTFFDRFRRFFRRSRSGKPSIPKQIDLPQDKSGSTARLLWIIPLGLFGCHRYYLARYFTAVLYTIVFVFLLFAWIVGLPMPEFALMVLGALLLLAWLVDGFVLNRLLKNQNQVQWRRWFARQSDRWTDSAGTVRDISRSVIKTGRSEKTEKQQLNFRIEETDAEGNVAKVVEVELIGQWITGNLRNGDSVKIRGKMSRENILRALEVENKTTDSRVTVWL
jgi:TM2 domain-containing membrane protein YozV